MAKSKVIIFIAGDIPTANEKTFIDKVNLQAGGFDVAVRSARGVVADPTKMHGGGAVVEACDYIAEETAGVAPDGGSEPFNGKTLYNPDAPANVGQYPTTQTIVKHGQKVSGVTGAGSNVVATISVVAGVISAIVCATS